MASTAFPKVVGLDLDGLVWTPEMYELWGSGGSPFRFDPKTLDCHDRSGTRVKLIGHTRAVLQQLARLKPDVRIAISSKTDEPSWARECLALIEVEPGLKFKDVLDEVVISKNSKDKHFELIRQRTGIAFEDMIFFDNEYGNIRTVSRLGVHCVYCPDGLTEKCWKKGIEEFAAKKTSKA